MIQTATSSSGPHRLAPYALLLDWDDANVLAERIAREKLYVRRRRYLGDRYETVEWAERRAGAVCVEAPFIREQNELSTLPVYYAVTLFDDEAGEVELEVELIDHPDNDLRNGVVHYSVEMVG